MKVPTKYADFVNVLSPNLTSKLPEHTGINDHTIKPVDSQQPPYGPIHSLEPVELETLMAYIETNLANRFIKPSKSLNRYSLSLVQDLPDRLGRAKRFTQLNLINAYY